ncbi:phage tail protein [Paenibacillus sp. 1P03SA]|uniref:phage tail-collar fiber domain-containing protein n=1 Tax=Paenibacillus sp. 1P03SA TaxID=3132294 RepID=UPI0039A34489
MGAFGGFVLTNKGRNLQAKAQVGVTLNYTRMGVGDGQLGGQSIPALTKLIGEKKSLAISKLKIQTHGRAVIGAVLSNQDVTTGFYFREIGIYAQDPDEGEILYCYGNAGSNAEYIPPVGGADIIEKSIDAIVVVGNAANVTATIDSSLVYATQGDLHDAEDRSKKYTDDRIAAIDITLSGEEILTELKKVDGSGSGLDADFLQGKSSSAFIEKATDGTIKGPIVVDTTNQTGKQVSVNAWGDLSASSGGQTVWGNNCYVDQGGKHRYSNTHATLGATGLRLNYGNIEYFDTGRIATTAGTEFTPVWKTLAPAISSSARSEFSKGNFTGDGDALSLFGVGHVYQALYPEGASKGRKGYVGYPGAGIHNFHIVNEYTDGGINLITQQGQMAKWNGDELLTRKTTVISGTDLNNIKQTGFYNGEGCPNAPGAGWYYYEVISHTYDTNWVKQTAHDFNTDKVFVRRGQSNAGVTTWYPWRQVVTNETVRVNGGKLEYWNGGEWKPAGLGGAEGVPVGFSSDSVSWSKWTACNTGRNTFATYKDKLYCINGSNVNKVELADMSLIKSVPVSSANGIAIFKERIYVYSTSGNYSTAVYDLELNLIFKKEIGLSFIAIAAANDAFYGVDSYGSISYFDLNLNLVRTVPRIGVEFFEGKLMVGPTGHIYYDYYSSNSSPYMYYVRKMDARLNVVTQYELGNYNTDWAVTAKGSIGYVYKNNSWSDQPMYIGYIRPDGSKYSYNTGTSEVSKCGASTVAGFYTFVKNTLEHYSEDAVHIMSARYTVSNASNYSSITPDSLGGVLVLNNSNGNGYLYRIVTRIKFEQP